MRQVRNQWLYIPHLRHLSFGLCKFLLFSCLISLCLYFWWYGEFPLDELSLLLFHLFFFHTDIFDSFLSLRPRLFAGKWFPFGKWIPGKVNSGKVNSWKVNSDVWQCYRKWTGKHFPMFVCVMENELENNLLINYFFSSY